ncbi:MAG: nucleotide exchange factor GrpE [Ruminococcaceae bacterium]|nr:nucleotide exchange factor GrpE [Oscillospiraceae bacterium]
MSKKKEDAVQEEQMEQETVEQAQPEVVEEQIDQDGQMKEQLAQQEDKYLRLAAEYDNYRKRTAKEKESIWTEVKADTAAAFLPVYDNLERAIKQETADEAYKKGVEMTMNQLKEVFSKLGIEEVPALGEQFDPNLHNAVMHIDDENFGENTIAEVFQAGFRCGEKVIRFSMVKVAN